MNQRQLILEIIRMENKQQIKIKIQIIIIMTEEEKLIQVGQK